MGTFAAPATARVARQAEVEGMSARQGAASAVPRLEPVSSGLRQQSMGLLRHIHCCGRRVAEGHVLNSPHDRFHKLAYRRYGIADGSHGLDNARRNRDAVDPSFLTSRFSCSTSLRVMKKSAPGVVVDLTSMYRSSPGHVDSMS